jgi:Family of unknown function (DUF5686)
LRYSQYLHKDSWHERFSLEGDFFYGFADETWRGGLQLMRRYDRKNSAFARLQFSKRVSEFNAVSDIPNLYNEVLCFFWRENQLKLYDKSSIRVDWGSYVNYDIFLYAGAEYQNRKNVVNKSNFSFVDKPADYLPNDIAKELPYKLILQEAQAVKLFSRLTWKPYTKVWLLPDDIDRIGSSWPTFTFEYLYNYYVDSKNDFHLAGINISKAWSLSRWGEFSVYTGARKVFSESTIDVPDRLYQRAAAMAFYNIPNQGNYFLSLPLYANMSTNYSIQCFAEHDFKGLFLDRVPLIRKIGLTELIRGGVVYTPESKWAGECSVGIGNLGVGVFRILRLDLAFRYDAINKGTSYLRLGLVRSLSAGR